jgi:uncharacterized protein
MLGAMPTARRTSRLQTFLEHADRPEGTLTYHEVQGFLFTLAVAPELVPPSEWLPLIFGGNEPGFGNVGEAQAIVDELMSLYNALNAEVADNRAALPADCAVRDDAVANLDDDAPLARWSRGFLRGHQWLEESWEPYIPEELDEEFAATLLTLSFFSSKRLATAFAAETGKKDLNELAQTISRIFAGAIAEYARMGRSIQEVLMSSEAADAGPRRSDKVGRNAPCPCGSGRKFKKCCGLATAPH